MRNRHSNKIYIDIFRCMIFLSLSFHLLFKVMFDSMIWRMCALNIQSNLWPVTCRVLWKTPRKNYTVFFYISLVVFVCVCLVFFLLVHLFPFQYINRTIFFIWVKLIFPHSKAWANKFTNRFWWYALIFTWTNFSLSTLNNHLSRWWRRTWYDVHRSWVEVFNSNLFHYWIMFYFQD